GERARRLQRRRGEGGGPEAPRRRARRLCRTRRTLMRRRRVLGVARLVATALASAAPAACAGRPRPLPEIAERDREARALHGQVEIALTRSRGATATTADVPLADLVERYGAARSGLVRALAAGASPPLSPEDERALEAMRRTLAAELAPEEPASASADSERTVDCSYDAGLVAN